MEKYDDGQGIGVFVQGMCYVARGWDE